MSVSLKNQYHDYYMNWEDILTSQFKGYCEGVASHDVCVTVDVILPSEIMNRYMNEQLAVGELEGVCHFAHYGKITEIQETDKGLVFTFVAETDACEDPIPPRTITFSEADIHEVADYYITVYLPNWKPEKELV